MHINGASHCLCSCELSPMLLSLTLFAIPQQAPRSMGFFQAKVLEWVATSSSRGLYNPGVESLSLASPALAGRFFTTEPPVKSGITLFRSFFA